MKLSDHEYRSDFYRRPYEKGLAEGMATALLDILEARGIDVDADARARILDCADEERLGAWVRRALTASTTDELFA